MRPGGGELREVCAVLQGWCTWLAPYMRGLYYVVTPSTDQSLSFSSRSGHPMVFRSTVNHASTTYYCWCGGSCISAHDQLSWCDFPPIPVPPSQSYSPYPIGSGAPPPPLPPYCDPGGHVLTPICLLYLSPPATYCVPGYQAAMLTLESAASGLALVSVPAPVMPAPGPVSSSAVISISPISP